MNKPNDTMTGKRPLTDHEYDRVETHIRDNNTLRDLTMIMLCRYTGYRISEVLSTRVKDVYRSNGQVRDSLLIMPRNMKKNRPRLPVMICEELKEQLILYKRYLIHHGNFNGNYFLMQSQKGANKAITYTQAYRIIQEAFNECDVFDNVGIHSFRKSFCDRVYTKSGFDLKTTQMIMGHSTIKTTEKYISFNNEKIKQTMEHLWE